MSGRGGNVDVWSADGWLKPHPVKSPVSRVLPAQVNPREDDHPMQPQLTDVSLDEVYRRLSRD